MLDDLVVPNLITSADNNYGTYADVRAVTVGAKFTNGTQIPNVEAVQFFVDAKKRASELKKLLPEYVFLRNPSGEIDRSKRIPTDVIELRNLELCCFAGDEVAKVGGNTGSITLMFENKTGDDRKIIVTCSHVAGDMSVSPAEGEFRGGDGSLGGCLFRANVLANSVAKNRHIEYDIGIGEVFFFNEFTDLGLGEGTGKLASFSAEGDLNRGVILGCLSNISSERTATIVSEKTTFRRIKTPDGGQITVHNLIACKGIAVPGDSGGIAYVEDRAVGIIVARADDEWLFIHPIEEAMAHLAAISGIELSCF